MKIVFYPALDARRRSVLQNAAAGTALCFAEDAVAAERDVVDADGFVGKLTPTLLAAARNLKWVQALTASLEHYMFAELVAHPCQLTNMRGLFSDVIAEHVLGLLLCFSRNLHTYVRNQSQRRWAPVGGEATPPDFVGGPGAVTAIDRAHWRLCDKRLCVVGMGGIGCEVARRCSLMGMDVVGVDPHPSDEARRWASEIAPPSDVDRRLADRDVVVIAAPHTPSTAGWWNSERFAAMKPGSYLVNVGRGAIVDTAALREAIVSGRLAGAALDVVSPEPPLAEDPLWAYPNVILTPHVAASSPVVADRHLDVLRDNLSRFVEHRPLRNVVRKADWC